MSIVTETRIDTLNTVGAKIEDYKDAAQREKAGLEATKTAMQQLAMQLEAQTTVVDRDLREGKIDLPQASAGKRYIAHCVTYVRNLIPSIEAQAVQAAGKINAFSTAMQYVKGVFDAEQAKLSAQKQAESEATELEKKLVQDPSPAAIRDALVHRPSGVRPPDPFAERRAQATQEPPQEPTEKPEQSTEQKLIGKKRKKTSTESHGSNT
jgi:hypothetical protein